MLRAYDFVYFHDSGYAFYHEGGGLCTSVRRALTVGFALASDKCHTCGVNRPRTRCRNRFFFLLIALFCFPSAGETWCVLFLARTNDLTRC